MINTTLCYLEQNNAYLMLHRIKKENDVNRDKWIGIGGKFEDGESPEECVRREVLEETGLNLLNLRYAGIITFVSDRWPTEYMHLFHSTHFSGKIKECDEGTLEWVEKNSLSNLSLWEGDKIFLKLLEKKLPFFSLKLEYQGEKLLRAVLNERELPF